MTFFSLLVVACLSLFLGYALVWRVTPSLHSPLMAVTNAISSVIVLGGFYALRNVDALSTGVFLGVLAALFLCTVNIVGGFMIAHRMLAMFRAKKPDAGR